MTIAGAPAGVALALAKATGAPPASTWAVVVFGLFVLAMLVLAGFVLRFSVRVHRRARADYEARLRQAAETEDAAEAEAGERQRQRKPK